MSPTFEIQVYQWTLRIMVSLFALGAGKFTLILPFVFWGQSW